MLNFLHELGKGGGYVLTGMLSVSLGCLIALQRPEALTGYAMVIGAAVGLVTAGGAIKAVMEARNGNGKPPA